MSKDGFTFDIRYQTHKANDPSKLRELLDNPRIAKLILGRPSMRLKVRHPWRLFRRLRKGAAELYLEEKYVGDVGQLKSLLDL